MKAESLFQLGLQVRRDGEAGDEGLWAGELSSQTNAPGRDFTS